MANFTQKENSTKRFDQSNQTAHNDQAVDRMLRRDNFMILDSTANNIEKRFNQQAIERCIQN